MGTLNSTTLYHNNFKLKFKQLKEAIKDLQRARDIIAYHREQQASFWNEDMWNVLIAVEEDIEYLTGELSMVKLNKIAEDLEKNGYLKEEKR